MGYKLNGSNLFTILKQHYPIVVIFIVLFIVFFISSVNTQRYLDSQSERIDDNHDQQLDARLINNDYRNLTIEYLADINKTLVELKEDKKTI